MIHGWEDRLRFGEEHEGYLDAALLRHGCQQIRPATMDEQHEGIDRHVLSGSRWRTVQYKSDSKVQKYKNCFIEVAHIGKYNSLGWACRLGAEWILYYDVVGNTAYLIASDKIQSALMDWAMAYPTRPARNENYITLGITVPLAIVQAIAIKAVPDIQRKAA